MERFDDDDDGKKTPRIRERASECVYASTRAFVRMNGRKSRNLESNWRVVDAAIEKFPNTHIKYSFFCPKCPMEMQTT